MISGERSPLSVAAYIHRTSMTDSKQGAVFNFARDDALVHSEVCLPPNAAPWLVKLMADCETKEQSQRLWNAVARAETRHDAQTTREFVIALPVELTEAQNITLMRDYIEQHLSSRGLVVDWAYHAELGNPHVHLMHTLRPVIGSGFGKKRESVKDDSGAPRRDKDGKIISYQFIGNRKTLVDLRTGWAETASHHLAMAGHDVVLDLRSYAAQGIKLTPSAHIGPTGTQFSRTRQPSEAVTAALDAKAITRDQLIAHPGRILDVVAAKMSVFDRRDVALALHTFIDDPTEFTTLLDAALQDKSLVVLKEGFGGIHEAHHTPARLAMQAQIAVEAAMSRDAISVAGRARFAVPRPVVLAAINRCPKQLSDQQCAAIEHITSGDDLTSIVGFAGAGKTSLLTAAVDTWTARGFTVQGAALASKAAYGLADGAGIESRTIASWMTHWKHDRKRLTSNDVLVLDEAGMVGSADMAALLSEVKRVGAKLVLIGDPEQLQPIAAGGAFRALVQQSGTFELDTVYRQNDDWARAATVQFQRGLVSEAMTAYNANGGIIETKDRGAAVAQLVADYLETSATAPLHTMLALAHRNDDILAINTAIQDRRRVDGKLGEPVMIETRGGTRSFSAGDRIIMLKNEKLAGEAVANSELGTVEAIDTTGSSPVFSVALDDGRTVTIDTTTYRDFDLGYATTVHKAQGATVDRTFVLASTSMDKYLAYVAASRHRVAFKLYVPKTDFDTFDKLVWTFSRADPKEMTLDYRPAYAEARGIRGKSAVPLDLLHLVSGGRAAIAALRERLTALFAAVCKSAIAPVIPARRSSDSSLDGLRAGIHFALRAAAPPTPRAETPRPDAPRPPKTKGTKIMDTTSYANITVKPTIDEAGRTGLLATWPRDLEANAIAKDMGGRWSNEEKAWAFSSMDPRTERAFDRINNRIASVAKSADLAKGVQFKPIDGLETTVVNGKVLITMPKDLAANRMVKAVDGVRWDAKAKAFSVQLTDADHVYDLNSTLDAVGVHLTETKSYAAGLAALNDAVPGLNAEISISERGVVDVTARPQYDRELITALKDGVGAKWDASQKTWALPIDPNDVASLATSPQFEAARNRLSALAVSAGAARNVENDHPLISATRRGSEIAVTLPRDLNANAALKKSGFEWNAAIKSWTVQPKDDAHLAAINTAISRAGNELDKAMIPHTPDRPGVPHMNEYYSSILAGGRDKSVTQYATDRRVRTAIDAIVAGAEALPEPAKAALAQANAARLEARSALTAVHAEPFAQAVGIDPIQAVSVIHTINAATDIQAKGIPAQQEVQRLAMESQSQGRSI